MWKKKYQELFALKKHQTSQRVSSDGSTFYLILVEDPEYLHLDYAYEQSNFAQIQEKSYNEKWFYKFVKPQPR